MKGRHFVWPVLFLCVTWIAGTAPLVTSAAPPKPDVHPCGFGAQPYREPPEVDVWRLPLNASREPELILAVHKDGERFCYRYKLDGVVETVAPAIHVRQGEHFAVRIVNDLAGPSRGESVSSAALPPCMPMAMPRPAVHHYVGYLNHPIDDLYARMPKTDTNLHLHGFQGPANQEDIFLSTLSTPMHACEYHITIPRTQPAGAYFYHPHAHGVSELEVASGLSGAWVVDAPDSAREHLAQHVIVLRYRIPFLNDNPFAPGGDAFSTDGAAHEAALKAAPPVSYDPFNPPPWPLTYPMEAGGFTLPKSCDGVGSEAVLSVNGAQAPATIDVPAGATQLYDIVNATSDSPKELELHDASGRMEPLHVVGFDGVPVSGDSHRPLANYVAMDRVMVAPSGRVAVLLAAPRDGALTLSSEHFCEGIDAFYQMHHDLLRVRAGDSAAAGGDAVAATPVRADQTPAGALVRFARSHPSQIRRRAITFTEYPFPKAGKTPAHAAFYITDTTDRNFREHPFWPAYAMNGTVPSHADIVVKAGTIEEWYLINTTMEAHVFHIHQMSFVAEKSPAGVPVAMDSVFMPVGRLLPNPRDPNYPLVAPSITKLLLDFRHVPRGTFVFHCHMLFHEDHGMMAIIRVE